MGFQELCEIADRELNAGIAEATLLERALAEGNGVEAHARQIFWHLRAKQLQQIQEAGDDASLRAVIAAVEAQERRLRSRKESSRWIWALACIAGMLGAGGFPSLAFRAVGKEGPAFFMFSVLSVASLALAVYAFAASRYHTHVE